MIVTIEKNGKKNGTGPASHLNVFNSPGTIPLCPHQGCAFRCCDFKQMTHILLYPGELQEALAQRRSVAHLEIVDSNYHGGMRAKCRAKDTATCDRGYKPLDCGSYPFFPELLAAPDDREKDGDPVVTVSKGSGCPIQGHEIPHHEKYVRDVWGRLIQRLPEIATWLRSFSRSNTDPFDRETYDPVRPQA